MLPTGTWSGYYWQGVLQDEVLPEYRTVLARCKSFRKWGLWFSLDLGMAAYDTPQKLLQRTTTSTCTVPYYFLKSTIAYQPRIGLTRDKTPLQLFRYDIILS